MSTKSEPHAGNVGRGHNGRLPLAPSCHGAEWGASNNPTVVIIPQNNPECQVRMACQTSAILALADDVLEKFNRAWAHYIALGDPGDYQAAMALADDRRALLQEIGGER